MKNIQAFITICSLGLAFLHMAFPTLLIDGVTVALLSIAIIPWVGQLFRSIELPGGLKVEYREIAEARERLEYAGLKRKSDTINYSKNSKSSLEEIAEIEPNLAIAGLRIEIENLVRDIARCAEVPSENRPIKVLLKDLVSHGHLSDEEDSAIQFLLPILNKAVHGGVFDYKTCKTTLGIGLDLIHSLKEKHGAVMIPQLLRKWKICDGDEATFIGTEISKSLVLSPNSFIRAMHEEPEVLDSWLQELETHTFNLFESDSDLEDDLYYAYKLRLLERMRSALVVPLDSEHHSVAKKIQNKLDKIEIRRIY